jgi:DNA invertase Pin-like site-specific DNA recombinase
VNANVHRQLNCRKRRILRRIEDKPGVERPEPMMAASNIHYEIAERARGIAPGGIGAIHLLARKIGLIEDIDRDLHLLMRHQPYHESDHVLNIAYNLLAGGSRLEHIEDRRNDEVYLDALGAERIPDPTTAGDFCRRFAFVEAQASSRKGRDERRIDELLSELEAGDRLVVSELSRLGRSLGQVIQIVDELVKRKVRFTAIKEAIRFEGKQDLQTKVMIALFGLFAEVERDLISERTKEGLAAARAAGRLLGRRKGSLGKSKLDGKEGEIRLLLEKEVSKASIAKIVGVSSTNLRHFIRTRKLAAEPSEGTSRGRTRGRRP